MLRLVHGIVTDVFCILSLIFVIHQGVLAQSIQVKGGNVTLSISNGTAGGQLLDVVNTTTTLAYQKQNATAKITVKTVCLGQNFNLEVVAINVTAGVAAPTVLLLNGGPAIDFVRDIPKNGTKNQTCRLQYTASSTFAQGNSNELNNDVHTVTYTIQLQ